jgi:hypothetical protein
MKTKFRFHSHEDYVAACEQLAEDLVSFEADSMDFIITIQSALINNDTIKWLESVVSLEK